MSPLLFLVCSFAVFRLAILISEDDGPANAIKKTRQSIPKSSSFWKGIRCFRCCSIWGATLASIFLACLHVIPWIDGALYVFAFSGAAIFLNRVSEQQH